MLATKADIREELDRLASHVAQARKLLADGGAGRPPARFPGAGTQPRIEYALRQVERRRADHYRAGTENAWSSNSASRCRTWNERRHAEITPPRASCWSCRRRRARARRRCRAICLSRRTSTIRQARTVGFGDDAAAAAERDRRRALSFRQPAPISRACAIRRAAGMGRGARQFLRHAARAGREGAGRKAATCCSTSTGRARSSCYEKMRDDVVTSSCCRRRRRN